MKRIFVCLLFIAAARINADVLPDYSSIVGFWNQINSDKLFIRKDFNNHLFYANESSILFDYNNGIFLLGMKGGRSKVVGFVRDGNLIKMQLERSPLGIKNERIKYWVIIHFIDKEQIWFEIDKNHLNENQVFSISQIQVEGIENKYSRAMRVDSAR